MTKAHAIRIASALLIVLTGSASAQTAVDEWEVLPGFTLSIDTKGFDLPTAIAFVPHP